MIVHTDTPVIDRCWNLIDSYGEICVHCGCCSKDPMTRTKARIEMLMRRIADLRSFDGWFEDPEIKALQERNIKTSLMKSRQKLRYYKARLRELTDGKKR